MIIKQIWCRSCSAIKIKRVDEKRRKSFCYTCFFSCHFKRFLTKQQKVLLLISSSALRKPGGAGGGEELSFCNILRTEWKKQLWIKQQSVKEAKRSPQKTGEGKLEIHPGEMRRKYHGFLFKETEAPSVEGMWARRAWGLLEQIHEGFFSPALMKRNLRWWRRQSGQIQVIKQMKKLRKDWHVMGSVPRLQQMRYFWLRVLTLEASQGDIDIKRHLSKGLDKCEVLDPLCNPETKDRIWIVFAQDDSK